jgi:type IV secretion system protein VirB1
MISAAAFAAYLSMCAASISPDTMRAIVGVESGGNPFALLDNTTRRSYFPNDARQARSIVLPLIAQGHSVDVGLAQVNSGNFSTYHVDAVRMLEPCVNLTVASQILANDYARALTVSSNPHDALWRAVSAYNTGSLFAGRTYVAAVIAQAMRAPTVPTISLLTTSSREESLPSILAPAAPAAPSPQTTPLSVEAAAAQSPLSSSKPHRIFAPIEHAGIPHTLDIQIQHTETL